MLNFTIKFWPAHILQAVSYITSFPGFLKAIISVAISRGREVKGQWREQELNPRESYITAVVI